MADSKRAERGEVVWLRPWKTGEPNRLGLALFVDSDENFFLMCDSDTRLAGHLDVVLPPGHAGIPYALAIMTHVGAWVDLNRVCSIPVARLSEAECVEIENARAGQRPRVLKPGRLLRNPALEPRWALIERKARAFLEAVGPVAASNLWIETEDQFWEHLSKLEVLYGMQDGTEEKSDSLKLELEGLHEALEGNPDWGTDPMIWNLIDVIENYIRTNSTVVV